MAYNLTLEPLTYLPVSYVQVSRVTLALRRVRASHRPLSRNFTQSCDKLFISRICIEDGQAGKVNAWDQIDGKTTPSVHPVTQSSPISPRVHIFRNKLASLQGYPCHEISIRVNLGPPCDICGPLHPGETVYITEHVLSFG